MQKKFGGKDFRFAESHREVNVVERHTLEFLVHYIFFLLNIFVFRKCVLQQKQGQAVNNIIKGESDTAK